MKPLVVLVLDDDPTIVKSISRAIKLMGHEPRGAQTSGEAFAMLFESHFDVLISDLNLGEPIDGCHVLELVAGTWPHIRRILASAAPRPCSFAQVTLQKPFGDALLTAAIAGDSDSDAR